MKPSFLRLPDLKPVKSSARLSLVLGLGIVVLGGTAEAGLYDFNDGTLSGLSLYNPLAPFGCGGTFTPRAGALQITAPASVNPAVLGPARIGAYQAGLSYSDFHVSIDLLGWDNKLNQAVGVMGRARELGLGTTDGYSATYLHWFGQPVSQLVLSRITDEQVTPLSGALITLDPARSYRIELWGAGNYLASNLYDMNDLQNPLVSCNAVDATYSSGTCGLVINATKENLATTLNVTLDNLSIVPEPSVASLVMLGGALLFGYRRTGARR